MSTMQQVPDNHPLMVEWNAYKQSPEFANSRKWAADERHVDGSLWAAFMAGWNSRDGRLPESTGAPLISPDGYALVPATLTVEMLDAAEGAAYETREQLGRNCDFDTFMHTFVQAMWRAALKSATVDAVASELKPSNAAFVRRFTEAFTERVLQAQKDYRGTGDSWETYSIEVLQGGFANCVDEGNAMDTAVFAAVLWARGASVLCTPTPPLEHYERMESALQEIAEKAHAASTGPAVPDVLWEIRGMAYEAWAGSAAVADVRDADPRSQAAIFAKVAAEFGLTPDALAEQLRHDLDCARDAEDAPQPVMYQWRVIRDPWEPEREWKLATKEGFDKVMDGGTYPGTARRCEVRALVVANCDIGKTEDES